MGNLVMVVHRVAVVQKSLCHAVHIWPLGTPYAPLRESLYFLFYTPVGAHVGRGLLLIN